MIFYDILRLSWQHRTVLLLFDFYSRLYEQLHESYERICAGGSTDILLPFFPCYMHSGGWFARVRGGGLAGSENLPEMGGWRLSALGALFYQVLFCLSTLLRRSVFLLIDPN
jgi:hypothetical protein